MALLGTKAGDEYLLKIITGQLSPTNWLLHLVQNQRTPAYDDTPLSWVECTLAGYSVATISLSAAVITPADPFSYATFDPVYYSFGSAGNVYGYYISDSSGTKVLAAEQFADPWSYGIFGGPGILTPVVGLL